MQYIPNRGTGFIIYYYTFIMKRLIVFLAMTIGSLAFFSSCEKGSNDDNVESSSEKLIFVNGVRYVVRSTALTVDNGLYFTAYCYSPSNGESSDDLTVSLTLTGCELNHEYDLTASDGSKKHLQVMFSDYNMDSYSVSMLGPKILNVMQQWGKSETREVETAVAEIDKDEEGMFHIYMLVDADGLSMKSDFECWIDDLDD